MSGRATPQFASEHSKKRLSSNLSQHLRNVSITNSSSSRSHENVLASLRAAQFVSFRPALPAELIENILEYLTIPDLLRCARVSRRMQEMVYDDTRWVQKLQLMKAWNEAEARQRVEQAMRKRMALPDSNPSNALSNGQPRDEAKQTSITLFDAGMEERHRESIERHGQGGSLNRQLSTGESLGLNSHLQQNRYHATEPPSPLHVFRHVKSIRGLARQAFSKVYVALAPFYTDLVTSSDHAQAQVFRLFRDPEHQALMLSNLKRFAQCDNSAGCPDRAQRIDDIVAVFESAVLREFELGLSARDIDGRMRRYAHVLSIMNGGKAAVDFFVNQDPLILRTMRLGDPLNCLEGVAPGHVDLNPSRAFFERLALAVNDKVDMIERAFPSSVDVLSPYISRICATVVNNYLTTLLDEAHQHGIETYVKAVSGTFEQALRFATAVRPLQSSPSGFEEEIRQNVIGCYEQHIDLYLAEEMNVFKTRSDAEVAHWEKELADQQTSTETFFMSNINRQAAKRDFLSSFKKVVMMPVSVIPSFGSNKSVATTSSTTLAPSDGIAGQISTSTLSMSETPRSSTPQVEAPTTELAAKAAIMNSRLEGIKSLFSLDVALNLTHLAKSCVDRTAIMVQMSGDRGQAAREQCDVLFVTLLTILGDRHIKTGFDKAVAHLSEYNPAEVRRLRKQRASDGNGEIVYASAGVAPLVTFLELVNIGDLIQQMIDVFYNQELVSKRLVDRDDFLDPAVKEKKRFEQMLDERVAAGLNKGIDVLVDEIEYLFASTQVATDFNPGAGGAKAVDIVDVGSTATARQVVDMVKSHTSMLIGSTDKNMLDVFMQEVGLRLFGALCKHFKRQRISVDGAITLISDINHYSEFVASLRQKSLNPYFHALRELGQIYLVYIEPPATYFGSNTKSKRGSILSTKASTTAVQAKELASIIADNQRYRGIFGTEEVYEFVERRADWYLIKNDVERAMYGVGCVVI